MEILRMMLFASHPSVYTLPGNWEAQPMVSTDVIYSTTIGMASFGIITITATVISILALKGKRKRV